MGSQGTSFLSGSGRWAVLVGLPGPWGGRWQLWPQACQVRQGAGAVLGWAAGGAAYHRGSCGHLAFGVA